MKPFEATRNVESSGIKRVVDYHIDPKNIAHITQILRNMYSDPVLAVVREYAANATDAHLEAGCPGTPIEVTLPTTFDPTLTIRDFGLGLSEADVEQLLCGYGASGKSKRDGALADRAIGGFGIGCKSAYAISDQFTYTVWHKGTKQIWNCYLDEHDCGRAALLSNGPSDGVSGIEVKIPIKQAQMSAVFVAAAKAFQWYETRPTIHNLPSGYAVEQQYPVVLDGWVLNNAVRWCFVTYPQNVTKPAPYAEIVMGGISYPLNWEKVEAGIVANYRDRDLFPYHRLVLHAPIGFFAIAPSREDIQYSPKVIKDLKSVFSEVVSCVATNIEADLLKQPQGWPRLLRAAEVSEGHIDKVKNGPVLQKYYSRNTFGVQPAYNVGKPDEVNVYQVEYPRNWGRVRRMRVMSFPSGTSRHYFMPDADLLFGWSEDPNASIVSGRLEHARNAALLPHQLAPVQATATPQGATVPTAATTAPTHYAIIFAGPKSARASLIKQCPWLENAPIHDIDAMYPKPKYTKGGSSGSGIQTSNTLIGGEKMFKLRDAPVVGSYGGTASQWWDPVPNPTALLGQKTKPVVFVIDGFRIGYSANKLSNTPTYGYGHTNTSEWTWSPRHFMEHYKEIFTLLGIKLTDCYGVKPTLWVHPKFDQTKVQTFAEYVAEKLQADLDAGSPLDWTTFALRNRNEFGDQDLIWSLIPHRAKLKGTKLHQHLEDLAPWLRPNKLTPTQDDWMTGWARMQGLLAPAKVVNKRATLYTQYKQLRIQSKTFAQKQYPLLARFELRQSGFGADKLKPSDMDELIVYIKAKDGIV